MVTTRSATKGTHRVLRSHNGDGKVQQVQLDTDAVNRKIMKKNCDNVTNDNNKRIIKSTKPTNSKQNKTIQNHAATDKEQVPMETEQNTVATLKPVPMALPIPDVNIRRFLSGSGNEQENIEFLNTSLPIPKLVITLNTPKNDIMISITVSWHFETNDQLDSIYGYEIYTYDVIKNEGENRDTTHNWELWCKITDRHATCIYFEEVLNKTQFFVIRAVDHLDCPGRFSCPKYFDGECN